MAVLPWVITRAPATVAVRDTARLPAAGAVVQIWPDRERLLIFPDWRNNLRAYSTAVVATALGVSRRWLDMVVASNRLPDTLPDRQGKSRAFTPDAVVTIAIAIELTERLGASLPIALDLATKLAHGGEHRPSPELMLRLDLGAIERRVALQLSDAVEANPSPARGRPPRRSPDSQDGRF